MTSVRFNTNATNVDNRSTGPGVYNYGTTSYSSGNYQPLPTNNVTFTQPTQYTYVQQQPVGVTNVVTSAPIV